MKNFFKKITALAAAVFSFVPASLCASADSEAPGLRGCMLDPAADIGSPEELDGVCGELRSIGLNTVVIASAGAEGEYYLLGEGEEDPVSAALSSAKRNGLKTYVTFDIGLAKKGGIDPFISKVHRFAEKYDCAGVILDDYYVAKSPESYGEYMRDGSGIGYTNWLYDVTEQYFRTAAEVIKMTDADTDVGIMINDMWANSYVNSEGSATLDTIQAFYDGHADTKRYIENGTADFVMVRAYGSTGSKRLPFGEVTGWWGSLAEKNDIPMYVVHHNEMIASGAEGWDSAGQLTEQLELLKTSESCGGSVFNYYGGLSADLYGSAELLRDYYGGMSEPFDYEEELPEESEVQEPPDAEEETAAADVPETTAEYTTVPETTTEDTTVETTTEEAAAETTTEEAAAETTAEEAAAETATEEAAAETATGETTTEETTTEETTTGDAAAETATEETTAEETTAEEAAAETTTGETTTEETTIEETTAEETTAEETTTAETAAETTAEETTAEPPTEETPAENAATVTYIKTLADNTIVYDAASSGSVPIPTLSRLPAGTVEVYKETKGGFYITGSGRRIAVSDAVLETLPAVKNNDIRVKSVGTSGKNAYIKLSLGCRTAFNMRLAGNSYYSAWDGDHNVSANNAEYLYITFENTDEVSALPSFEKNQVFSAGKWEKVTENGKEKNRLVLTLRQKGVYFGHGARYDENGDLILYFPVPVNTLGSLTIAIDPGHGYGKYAGVFDPGAVGEVREADVVLEIAKKLETELTAMGAKVIRLKTESEFILTKERPNYAAALGCDIFISIHANKATGQAKGVEAYYFTEFSQPLADLISKAVGDYYAKNVYSDGSGGDRGEKYSYYHVTLRQDMPSVLFEVGFVDNEDDASALSSGEHCTGIARAIAQGIADYVNKSAISYIEEGYCTN